MTTISGVSSAWQSASAHRTMGAGRMAERMLAKFDADGSGGVNTSELQGLLDDVAQKTGVSGSTQAADLLTQGDSNGDGSLDSSELSTALQSVLPPPPSTMAFAQSREATGSGTGQAGDDLFGKVDADASGAVSAQELQALLEKMSGGTASQTGVGSDALFSQLDTDGDGGLTQAEFDAARPSGASGDGGGMGAMGGMPPPPPGGAGGAQEASASDSTTYDPLDTNEDGVVSAAELAAGATQETQQDAITALFQAIDTDGDSQISSSESQSFIDRLTRQFASATTSGTASSDAATGTSSQAMDLRQLAQLARRQYEAAASAWNSTSATSTLSAVA